MAKLGKDQKRVTKTVDTCSGMCEGTLESIIAGFKFAVEGLIDPVFYTEHERGYYGDPDADNIYVTYTVNLTPKELATRKRNTLRAQQTRRQAKIDKRANEITTLKKLATRYPEELP